MGEFKWKIQTKRIVKTAQRKLKLSSQFTTTLKSYCIPQGNCYNVIINKTVTQMRPDLYQTTTNPQIHNYFPKILNIYWELLTFWDV